MPRIPIRSLPLALAGILSLLVPARPVVAESETLDLTPAEVRTVQDRRRDDPRHPDAIAAAWDRPRMPPSGSGRAIVGTDAVSYDHGRRAVGRTENMLARYRGYVRFELGRAEQRVADGKILKVAFLDFQTGPTFYARNGRDDGIENSTAGCDSLIDRMGVLETPVGDLRSGLPPEARHGKEGGFHRLSPRRYDVTPILRGWLHERLPNHGLLLTRHLLPTGAKVVQGGRPRLENARRRWEAAWLRQRAYKVEDNNQRQVWRYRCQHELSGFRLTLVFADAPPRKPLALQEWRLQPDQTNTFASAEKNGAVYAGHLPRGGLRFGPLPGPITPGIVQGANRREVAPEDLRILVGTWAVSEDQANDVRRRTTNLLNRYRGFVKFDFGPLAQVPGAGTRLRSALLSLKTGTAHGRTRNESRVLPNSKAGCHRGAVIETISTPTAPTRSSPESNPMAWHGTTFQAGEGFHKLSPTQYDLTEIVRRWLRGEPNHGMWVGARIYPAGGTTELVGGRQPVGKHRQRRADYKWLRQPAFRVARSTAKTWQFVCLAELHSFELTLLFDKE